MKAKLLRRYIICGVCLIAAVTGFFIVPSAVGGKVAGQTAAEYWQQGELAYKQLSVFFPKELSVDRARIESFENGINTALTQDSYAPENPSARLWVDCWSGETEVMAGNGAKTLACRAVVTGGDYFLINAPEMFSGWYYQPEDVMQDAVIIDRETAWQLYGGTDLAGMKLTVNGTPCVIMGVFDDIKTKSARDAYGSKPTVFVSGEIADRLGCACPVTYYGAILPDPVKGYASALITDKSGLAEDTYELVVNTGRFSVGRSLLRLGEFGLRSERKLPIGYTFTENSARYAEDICTLSVTLAAAFSVWPCVYLIMNIALAVKNRKKIFSFLSRGRDIDKENSGGKNEN